MARRPARRKTATVSSDKIALASLVVAVCALAATIFTTYVSQRAYVVVSAASVFNVSAAGSPLQAYVRIENGGKTRARIESRKVGALIAKELPDTLDPDLKEQPGTFVSWPNQPNFVIRSPTHSKLTNSDIENLDKSELHIFVFGTIEYSDAFCIHHKTTFCHYYSGSETANLPPNNVRGYHASQAKYCDKFNYAN